MLRANADERRMTHARAAGRNRWTAAMASVAFAVPVMGGLIGCDGPWERGQVARVEDTRTFEVYADTASLGTWLDKRERSQITHGMLVLRGPKERRSYFAPDSTYVVTTSSPLIAERAGEMTANTLGLPSGMTTNFALGTTVTVRIERIGAGGQREPIDEGRVSFLEIVVADEGSR
jgi:hypothetical protein